MPTTKNQLDKAEGLEELREKLADIEHQRWADWQKWCHKILRRNCGSPELEKVLERWDEQIATSYKDLSEQEKDSDREQVDRYFPFLKAKIKSERTKAYREGERAEKERDIKACSLEFLKAIKNPYDKEIKEILEGMKADAYKKGVKDGINRDFDKQLFKK